ncbi:BTAD domain-containing putative transcriptional regulator [Micromonospora sp. CA-263727]|uniref:BTAD domain-containing putative transcriptional regulator n=1 Tax=Micromonospora sp. CA-263727 TaxID=3239967 RepID=UPI003D8E9A18
MTSEWSLSGPDGLVRTRRRQLGLTQRELAGRAGVSIGMLRDLEQGRTTRAHRRLTERLTATLRLDPVPYGIPAGDGAATDRAGLRLRVLGPLALWRDGVALPSGQPAQRAVLGLLALNPDVDMHRDDLIDMVWGQGPPAAAVNVVQSYIARLRRLLDPGRSPFDPDGVLVSTGRRYRLRLGPDRLDWARFTELTRQAGVLFAAGDAAGAARLFGWALALWPDGDALSDVARLRGGPALIRATRAWSAAVTAFGDAAVAAGRAREAVPYLWRLTEQDPLNQRAHAGLMRALAADGQQAAALRVFAEVRARLNQRLGLRADADLVEAQLAVLRQQTPAGVRLAELAPLCQLPARVPGFVGRDEDLRRLDEHLDAALARRMATVVAVDGAAGIGKTALAVRWAHSVASRFPDGQLFLDLRGHDPVVPPLGTGEAVGSLLETMRVPAGRIPAFPAARIALYRSLLAGRRVLILLDDAWDCDQVRPLLPEGPGCLIVVTGRRRLTALGGDEGVQRLTLGPFAPADARRLLVARLGEERVTAEPAAVCDLIALCAGLPLALGLAAARIAARPEFPVASLTGRLRDAQTRLDALSGEDPGTDLRALLWSSYRRLNPSAARLFRLLGPGPAREVTPAVAAELCGLPRPAAGRALAELAAVHLLGVRAPGRYGMHVLVRAYAAELARRPGPTVAGGEAQPTLVEINSDA